jgi:hypothetical protein
MSAATANDARSARSHRQSHIFWLATGIGLAVAIAAAYTYHIVHDPAIPLLLPHGDAQWIRVDAPLSLNPSRTSRTIAGFRTSAQVPAGFQGAALRVWAFRWCEVSIDGSPLLPQNAPATWKEPNEFVIPASLRPGTHVLAIVVRNLDAPPLLCASCDEIRVHTDHNWEATGDNHTWRAAGGAADDVAIEGADAFHLSPRQILAPLPIIIVLLIATTVIGGMVVRGKTQADASSAADARPSGPPLNAIRKIASFLLSPPGFRWLMLIAWLVLAGNNICKIPYYIGYDARDHFQYIQFIADNHRLPKPTEGWEYFQPPLYYLVSAPLYRLVENRFPLETCVKLLRLIPLLCGLAMIEICYRALRRAFPGRGDLQIVGTAVGGLLPMNLYMSQFISNEPFTAMMSALVVLSSVRVLSSTGVSPVSGDASHGRDARGTFRPELVATGLGFLLGLAMLSKISAAALLPPVAGVIVYATARRGYRFARSIACVALLAAVAFACAAVHFRNWSNIGTGTSAIAGWDPSRVQWWQEPGYRVPQHFLRFGRVLIHPIFNGARGLWDSLYATLWADGFLSGVGNYAQRPPWHYTLLQYGVWLAVVPMLALLAGVMSLFRRHSISEPKGALTETNRRPRAMIGFGVAVVACYLAAEVHLYLMLPIYACGKASYMMGATPCFAILVAAGFDQLSRNRKWSRALAAGLLLGCAANAYLTYFVV